MEKAINGVTRKYQFLSGAQHHQIEHDQIQWTAVGGMSQARL